MAACTGGAAGSGARDGCASARRTTEISSFSETNRTKKLSSATARAAYCVIGLTIQASILGVSLGRALDSGGAGADLSQAQAIIAAHHYHLTARDHTAINEHFHGFLRRAIECNQRSGPERHGVAEQHAASA